MARPRKAGLDYFPFDVDFFSDEKVVCIAGEFGTKGELTIIKLLCAIYRNGYFTLWNDALKYKLKREIDGASGDLLDKIVHTLVRRGFFSESLFNSDSVLTSEGIQRRYFEATKFRQRDRDLPYLLLIPRVNYPKTDISHWETPVSQQESTQIKRNKIKISSDDDTKSSPSSPPFVEEKFLKEFFCEGSSGEQDAKRLAALDSLRRSFGLPDMESMKDIARQVMADWKIRRHTPKDWEDAANHLVSTIRKKCAAKESQASGNGKRAAENGNRSTGNYIAELDRQVEKQKQDFEERQKNRIKPADYIRSKGYDPEKVTMTQVMNPDWCSNNPPTKAPDTETT